MDPNTFIYLGTVRTTMNSLGAFRSVPQGRIELTCPEGWFGTCCRHWYTTAERTTQENVILYFTGEPWKGFLEKMLEGKNPPQTFFSSC